MTKSTYSDTDQAAVDAGELLRIFIVDDLLFGDAGGLEDSTSLIENGIVDSMGIMELVAFIEKQFCIKVKDEELIPDNLDSIAAIVAFLEGKKHDHGKD